MRLKCFKSGGGIGMVQDVSVFWIRRRVYVLL